MQVSITTTLEQSQKQAIVRLWNAEYPRQLAYKDMEGFNAYLEKLGDPIHYVASDYKGKLLGWLCVFDRDGEHWLVILVDTTVQRQGIGTQLLSMAKQGASVINGWVTDQDNNIKADGTHYKSPLEFYRKQGFTVLEDVRMETGTVSLVKVRWTDPGKIILM